jgi:hypothetical protein
VVVPTPGPEKVDSANSNAIQFIMQEKLKTKPANAYLAERQKEQQQQPFKFQQHFGFDIIEDELVLAGTLADPKDCAGYAQLLQQDACDRLCSGNKSCTRRCRIGCYVQRAGITYFYHGSTREVVDAFTTEFASAVFTRDELTLRSMRAVDIFLDRAMESTDLDRFKMRAVALKSAPGAVAYVADVAAWCTLCLESPDVPVSEVELEPRYKQILVDQEPVLGPPHTSEWQRVYEQRVYGGLQVNEFLHGVLVAVDGMDLKCLATRKLKPGYVPRRQHAQRRQHVDDVQPRQHQRQHDAQRKHGAQRQPAQRRRDEQRRHDAQRQHAYWRRIKRRRERSVTTTRTTKWATTMMRCLVTRAMTSRVRRHSMQGPL